MRGLFILLWSLIASQLVLGQQVIQIQWPSKQTAPPVTFGTAQNNWMPALRLALANVPEETLLIGGLYQGQLLGLTTNEAQRLQTLFVTNYARLRVSEAFRSAPSALAYCLSDLKPTNGLATVYVPANVSTNTPTIVFLHGYGGSLLVFVHYIADVFPNHLIVCPAYGLSCANIPQAYITESLRAVNERFPAATNQLPLLTGLSAGGVGACRLYGRNPVSYRRLIAIAASPPVDAVAKFDANSDLRFFAGGAEGYVMNGDFGKLMTSLALRTRHLDWKIVPDADHFFLLSHSELVKLQLREWEAP